VIALDSEIGSAMTIENVSWQRVSSGTGDSTATFPDFQLYMGL